MPPEAVVMPMVFERNEGQTDGRVRFLARRGRSTVFFTPREVVLTGVGESRGEVLRLRLLEGGPDPELEGEDELPGRTNYFLGPDSQCWLRNVPTYGKVRYRDVAPGVDVVFYERAGDLELDVVAGPLADPGSVDISLVGGDAVCLDEEGVHVEKEGRSVATP